MMDAIEHNKNSSSSGSRKENEQNSVRVVATGFAESSTEEEVREFSQQVIKKHAMKESHEETQFPTKPITHAFSQFKTEGIETAFSV